MSGNGDMLLFALNASFAHQALGVLTLSAYINSRMNQNVCVVLECNVNERDDEIFYKLYSNAKEKKIVGFSCYIWNIEKMLKFAENLKKLLPDIYIVFGGPEVSYYNKNNKNNKNNQKDFPELYPFVDFLIPGEGEEQLFELCMDLNKSNGCTQFTPNNYNNNSHEILYKNAGDYHTVYYESSRGCPFKCSYCISGIDTETETNNKKVRAKNVEQVLTELKFIEDKYYLCENSRINIIKFCDRTFNFNITRSNELYKSLIERACGYQNNPEYNKYNKKLLPYQFEIYPDLFDKNSFEILKQAPPNLFHIEIGIQSLNLQTLESIGRKKTDIDLILNNIAKIKSLNNIHIHLDLIAGLPYEDLQSFIDGFNILYNKICDNNDTSGTGTGEDFIQIGFLKLLRGTRIREKAELHEYIYESSPPYTVLQNKYMNFGEIMFLHDIEKIYKRYISKAYSKAFAYVYKNYFPEKVFDLFRTLSAYWRDNNLFDRAVSQKDAFTAFFNAFKYLPDDSKILSGLLTEDYYLYEKKRLNLDNID